MVKQVLDIETVMNEIAVIMKRFIPFYIYKMNIEKGDTILGIINIITDETSVEVITEDMLDEITIEIAGENAYNNEAYYKWEMRDKAPFRVSFLQYLSKEPEIEGIEPAYDISIRYSISIACLIMDTGDSNWPIIKARYNRIIYDVIKNKIVPKYNAVKVESIKSILMEETDTTSMYDIAEIQFSLVLTQ